MRRKIKTLRLRAGILSVILSVALSGCRATPAHIPESQDTPESSTTQPDTLSGTDLFTVSGNATLAYEKASVQNGMTADGVTVRADSAYSGYINGIFDAYDTLAIRFGFPKEAYDDAHEFTLCFTDVNDARNAVSVLFRMSVQEETGGWMSAYVVYKDCVRTASADGRIWYDTVLTGSNALSRPHFSGGWGDPAASGLLILSWDEYMRLHVRASGDLNVPDDFTGMRDLAVFDGTADRGFAAGQAWGLPEIDFSSGYTVSFSSGITAPDVCFHTLSEAETLVTPICDWTQPTLAEEPAFYTAWKQTERVTTSRTDMLSVDDDDSVALSEAGITVGEEAGIAYSGQFNGTFRGDCSIAFSFPDASQTPVPDRQFSFTVKDTDGDPFFDIVFMTSDGWWTHAYVRVGDEIRALSRYGENDYATAWETPVLYFRKPWGIRQMLRPGLGASYAQSPGYIRLQWSDDILSVHVLSVNGVDTALAVFDGSAKPDCVGPDQSMSPTEPGFAWGLEKATGLTDGYTIAFSAAGTRALPVVFSAVNGVSLGIGESIVIPGDGWIM